MISRSGHQGRCRPGSREGGCLEAGNRVRILRAPYLGAVGRVEDVLEHPQTIESGARVPVARVNLAEGQSPLVPLANLEVIR